MSEIVNTFLLEGDKLVSKMYLRRQDLHIGLVDH